MKQLIETVETLRVRGIGFRSLTEALDTTTAQGRLVFHMFGALAEFERSLIRERTQAGLAATRRQGRSGGRPPKRTEDDLDVARALLANPDIDTGGEFAVLRHDLRERGQPKLTQPLSRLIGARR
jgi:DNA invertase Pin-like site-specific DNA recombinase